MNTWWKVADWLESGDLAKAESGLEVIVQSKMPPEVLSEAAQLLVEVAELKKKLDAHSRHMLSKMDGVMWPVI